LDVHQEERREVMTISFRDVPTQRDRTPIPSGMYCLKVEVTPGGAGDGGILRRAKNGRSLMLELKCEVVGGEHEGRWIWDYPTVAIDESKDGSLPPLDADTRWKLQTSVRLGLVRIKAIIDSALGLDPNDRSEATEAKRDCANWRALDGIMFWAEVVETEGDNKYGPSNKIDYVVTRSDPAYPATTQAIVPRKSLKDDMDDEIPF
jgi:hypothetical protein